MSSTESSQAPVLPQQASTPTPMTSQPNSSAAPPATRISDNKPKANIPFPSVTGSCFCERTRYRLLAPPLYCFACHCASCQKTTGTVFSSYVTIEACYIVVTGSSQPTYTMLVPDSHVAKVKALSARTAVGGKTDVKTIEGGNEASKTTSIPQNTTASEKRSGEAAKTGAQTPSTSADTIPEPIPSTAGTPLHRTIASCPSCHTNLWTLTHNPLSTSRPPAVNPSFPLRSEQQASSEGSKASPSAAITPVLADVKIGTLEHPELFEPDMHCFIQSKVPWIHLPPEAKTSKAFFDYKKVWPESSLRRWEQLVKRAEMINTQRAGSNVAVGSTSKSADEGNATSHEQRDNTDEEEDEADRTPTAPSPPEDADDAAFEARYQEAELALQQRLEALTLKLAQQEAASASKG